jgi:L-ascorbate metabolism protein UlaG (beta-lactamase superfamily)
MSHALTITRIANSCTLLDFDGEFVLTDPYFTERWHLHCGEPFGMTAADLPRLSAVVVSNFIANHWDARGASGYVHKADTPVFVPTDRMARTAARAGFTRATKAAWGERHQVTERLHIDVVEAHRQPGGAVNSYVIDDGATRVFFGGEARDLEPLRAYRAGHDPVDVALLPVNGLHIPVTGPKLVMDSDTALEGARILGARELVAIHDAHRNDILWSFIRRNGSGELARAHATASDAEVVCVPTGVAWSR